MGVEATFTFAVVMCLSAAPVLPTTRARRKLRCLMDDDNDDESVGMHHAPSLPSCMPSKRRCKRLTSCDSSSAQERARPMRCIVISDDEGGSPVRAGFEKRAVDSDDDSNWAHLDRVNVMRFLDEASVDELQLVSGLSVKRAKLIVGLRPFNSWSRMVSYSLTALL